MSNTTRWSGLYGTRKSKRHRLELAKVLKLALIVVLLQALDGDASGVSLVSKPVSKRAVSGL